MAAPSGAGSPSPDRPPTSRRGGVSSSGRAARPRCRGRRCGHARPQRRAPWCPPGGPAPPTALPALSVLSVQRRPAWPHRRLRTPRWRGSWLPGYTDTGRRGTGRRRRGQRTPPRRGPTPSCPAATGRPPSRDRSTPSRPATSRAPPHRPRHRPAAPGHRPTPGRGSPGSPSPGSAAPSRHRSLPPSRSRPGWRPSRAAAPDGRPGPGTHGQLSSRLHGNRSVYPSAFARRST